MLRIQPGTARPGDPVLVTVRGLSGPLAGRLGEWSLRFQPIEGGFQALVGLPVELAEGALEVKVHPVDDEEGALTGSLEIVSARFPRRQLSVARRYVQPPARVRRRIAEDRAAFARALAQAPVPRLFREGFSWPRPPVVTAPFGDLRIFNGKRKSQHFGIDLDGRTGDPIHAANAGRVVLVRDCYASGKTVLLYHGADLYTAYFHLSEFRVREGETVPQGALLGLVGKTGRVTGPHLHWGVKVDGRWVNGETLVRLDFE